MRAVLVETIDSLQRLLDALDAEAACRTGTASETEGADADDAPERHAAPEVVADEPSIPTSPAVEPVMPTPMPRGGYWG